MMPLDDMYREVILDHYRAPRGKKPLENADVSSNGHNPACGDELQMQLQVDGDKLANISVDCKGCAISVASGSMLAETVKGRSLEEVRELAETIRKMLKGEIETPDDDLGDLGALSGVRQFPVRIKCALLAWVTLLEGLDRLAEGKKEGEIVISADTEL